MTIHSKSELPLSESTFFILLSLAPGPSHGYAIIKDVQQLSHERVVLSTGTLYGAVKRLLEMGWIRRIGEPSADDTSRTPRTYALTDGGRRVLNAEVARLQELVQIARKQTARGIA